MIEKQVQFLGRTSEGIFCQALFGSAGAFEKTAGAPAFSDWATGDQLRSYVQHITKADRQRYVYVLVNALGASEYFGPNINADWFPWEALKHEGDDYGYRTFLGAHAFAHHVNKDSTRAFGVPVLSALNEPMKRVELIVRIDREKAKLEGHEGIVQRIDRGEFPDVSMGCRVPEDWCSICWNPSKTKDDYCIHMRPPPELRHLYGPNKILSDGRIICVHNLKPKFFDISFVFIGADKTAKVMMKLASVNGELDLSAYKRRASGIFVPAGYEKVAGSCVCRKCGGPVEGRHMFHDVCNRCRPGMSQEELSAHPCPHTPARFRKQAAQGDILPGGKADNIPFSALNQAALRKGQKHELEHTRSWRLAKEIASDHVAEDPKYYDKLEQIEKKAEADLEKLAEAFGQQTKTSSHRKLSEIIKSVPSMRLNALERSERSLPSKTLDALANHDVGSTCSTTGMMGIILKPHEFQRIVLIRLGEGGMADELDHRGCCFQSVPKFDFSVPVARNLFSPELARILMSVLRERTAFGAPFSTRVVKVAARSPLPTQTQVADPLLDKIAAAYNGYRFSLFQALGSAVREVEENDQLRQELIGDDIAGMFSKAASVPLITEDTMAYFAGAFLDRQLISTTAVARATTVDVGSLLR